MRVRHARARHCADTHQLDRGTVWPQSCFPGTDLQREEVANHKCACEPHYENHLPPGPPLPGSKNCQKAQQQAACVVSRVFLASLLVTSCLEGLALHVCKRCIYRLFFFSLHWKLPHCVLVNQTARLNDRRLMRDCEKKIGRKCFPLPKCLQTRSAMALLMLSLSFLYLEKRVINYYSKNDSSESSLQISIGSKLDTTFHLNSLKQSKT